MRAKLEQLKGQRDTIQRQVKQLEGNVVELTKEMQDTEKAQSILQIVGQETQQKVKQFIEDMVTMAMESVFDDPYSFEVDFVIKRGKTEAELFFVRNGNRIKPIDASGGGVVDLASFVLRICLLSLKVGAKSETIILDEPMKFVSRNYIGRAGELIKKLSDDLGYQFIFITHVPELVECADRVFEVKGLGLIEQA